MPYSDPEKRKQYNAELQRRRRAAQSGSEIPSTSAVATLPNKPIPGQIDFDGGIYSAPEQKTEFRIVRTIEDPQDIADETRKRLRAKGWLVWTCTKLDNDRIVIVRDETVGGYPQGLPVYTEAELKQFDELTLGTIRRIHAIKKLELAELTSIVIPEMASKADSKSI